MCCVYVVYVLRSAARGAVRLRCGCVACWVMRGAWCVVHIVNMFD